jgi:hypothetical protein
MEYKKNYGKCQAVRLAYCSLPTFLAVLSKLLCLGVNNLFQEGLSAIKALKLGAHVGISIVRDTNLLFCKDQMIYATLPSSSRL